MWYYSWILGVLLACAFAIINILWYEFQAGGFESSDQSVTDHDTAESADVSVEKKDLEKQHSQCHRTTRD